MQALLTVGIKILRRVLKLVHTAAILPKKTTLDTLWIFLSKDHAAFGHTAKRMPGKYTF